MRIRLIALYTVFIIFLQSVFIGAQTINFNQNYTYQILNSRAIDSKQQLKYEDMTEKQKGSFAIFMLFSLSAGVLLFTGIGKMYSEWGIDESRGYFIGSAGCVAGAIVSYSIHSSFRKRGL